MSWVGDVRARFALQQPTGVPGDSYTTVVAGVPGSIRSAGGGESVKFGGTSAVGQDVVTIRYRSDVRAEWRLTSGGRTWQIANYGDPDGRRRWLRIYCQELL